MKTGDTIITNGRWFPKTKGIIHTMLSIDYAEAKYNEARLCFGSERKVGFSAKMYESWTGNHIEGICRMVLIEKKIPVLQMTQREFIDHHRSFGYTSVI